MLNYEQINSLSDAYIKSKIYEILKEDIPTFDFTSLACIDENSKSTAIIEAVDDLVFIGKNIIKNFFDEKSNVNVFFEDGDFVYKGSIIATIDGNTREILSKERSMLNLIQRLSGIATITRKYVELASPYNVKILDTRKTTPLLRLFEKYAVNKAGGYNHRLDLSSAILIKDNHIKGAANLAHAINSAKKYNLNIEIEAENFEQIKEICKYKINGILLDNMNRNETIESVKYIRNLYNKDEVYIISSGGINLKNINNYLDTGVDGISIGALTHSVKSSDIRLELK